MLWHLSSSNKILIKLLCVKVGYPLFFFHFEGDGGAHKLFCPTQETPPKFTKFITRATYSSLPVCLVPLHLHMSWACLGRNLPAGWLPEWFNWSRIYTICLYFILFKALASFAIGQAWNGKSKKYKII